MFGRLPGGVERFAPWREQCQTRNAVVLASVLRLGQRRPIVGTALDPQLRTCVFEVARHRFDVVAIHAFGSSPRGDAPWSLIEKTQLGRRPRRQVIGPDDAVRSTSDSFLQRESRPVRTYVPADSHRSNRYSMTHCVVFGGNARATRRLSLEVSQTREFCRLFARLALPLDANRGTQQPP